MGRYQNSGLTDFMMNGMYDSKFSQTFQKFIDNDCGKTNTTLSYNIHHVILYMNAKSDVSNAQQNVRERHQFPSIPAIDRPCHHKRACMAAAGNAL